LSPVLGGSFGPSAAWGTFTTSAQGPNHLPAPTVTLYGLTKHIGGYSTRYRLTNLAAFGINMVDARYNGSNLLVTNINDTLLVGQTKYYDLALISSLLDGYSGHVTISADGPITANVAPTLLLTGPSTVALGVAQAFTGAVQPLSLTIPITYQWSARDQSDLLDTAGFTDTVSFAWSAFGPKVITLTVTGGDGEDTRTLNVTPQAQPFLLVVEQ
jgi:hypothetical protein